MTERERELNQLASSWCVVHIVPTLAIIGNVILNNKFKVKGKNRLFLSSEQ